MWFHIARSEGYFATDAEGVDMCLSDTYYAEDVERIPREPTQPIPTGINHREEYESEDEESGDSSSSCSEAEESDAEQSGDSDDDNDDGNQSGNEAGKSNDAADVLDADQLFGPMSSPGDNDRNATEAEHSPRKKRRIVQRMLQ